MTFALTPSFLLARWWFYWWINKQIRGDRIQMKLKKQPVVNRCSLFTSDSSLN